MDCFLCQDPSAKFLCLSNNKTNEESKICEKCSLKSKSYCSTCGNLDHPLKQIWDQYKNPHCKSCFKQTKCKCGVMSIIECNCELWMCRECSIQHFCQKTSQKNHFFSMYQETQKTPDADYIDSYLISIIPRLEFKINNLQEFYLNLQQQFRNSKNTDNIIVSSFSLYLLGYSELATKTLKSIRNINNFKLLDLQSYFDPDINCEEFNFDELVKYEDVNRLDRIRVATLLKYRKLDKKSRKYFMAKKLKYEIFNNLCPSYSLLKAITIYFETTRNNKYLDFFIDYVSVHFQGCFELGRLYYVKALNLYKQNDYAGSDKCFVKSLEIMNSYIHLASPFLNNILFKFAKNLRNLGRSDECLNVLLRILKMQNLDQNKNFIIKIFKVLESINDLREDRKIIIQNINYHLKSSSN